MKQNGSKRLEEKKEIQKRNTNSNITHTATTSNTNTTKQTKSFTYSRVIKRKKGQRTKVNTFTLLTLNEMNIQREEEKKKERKCRSGNSFFIEL